ncbi:MAG: Uma2 family endonuclease [Acidobacteria bacterium]|nr:Uma2 family endonuclease [Acidobacteriota bacterium]
MAITKAAEFVAAMPDASQLLSDEPEMESSLHFAQLALLVAVLEWWWRDRHDFFIGANLSVYFSTEQLKSRDFRGPDFFIVKGTEQRPRKSWVVWEEGGKYPDLIIELLSDSTENIDREIKLELYQDRFRTPEYFWFSPDTLEFVGWRLVDGKYRKIEPNEKGWRWSSVLELYLGIEDGKLRYFTGESEKVASPQEEALINKKIAEFEAARAERETTRADQEAQRADRETLRAEQLATKLRELGVDPDVF